MVYMLIVPGPFIHMSPPPVAIMIPSLYGVEFKFPRIKGLMQRLTVYIPGYNRHDAFHRVLHLIPPYSKNNKG
ncbi:hypothetical protein KEJ23_01705 [Candidatus Bathyarchaeota archaeon]|nr:hypothetical protein [Candidatus Bathyarchaeota archaeon]